MSDEKFKKQGSKEKIHRRKFLRALGGSSLALAGLSLLHCRQSLAGHKPTSLNAHKGRCLPTEDNIEGPYFCAKAPSRMALAHPKEPGQPIVISGRVLQPDCKTPIPGATIEIWQANAKGQYDNSCFQGKSNFRLRGQLKADAKGHYRYTSVFPGRYRDGSTYRPAHIHYKVSAPGYRELTTQLYFDGDPYIKGDPFVKASLIIKVDKSKKRWRGTFDIILAATPKKP